MKKHNPIKPRLAIYGVGQFGRHIAKIAAQKGWPIVAAYNRAGEKVGKDLGRLAGLDRDMGVIVQDCDTANYDTLQADVALITATNSLEENFPAYKRFLNAGVNVLCLGGQSYFPYGNNPALAAEIDSMAKRNNVTFTGSGIWDMSRIWAGILVTGPCTEIKSLFHRSITDVSRQILTKAQAYELAVGISEKDFWDKGYANNLIALLYKTIPEHVLTATGYTIAETDVRLEPVTFDIPTTLPFFEEPIPPGHCVGTRIVCSTTTHQGVTARAEIELRLFKPGEVEHMFWQVEGRPSINVRTERSDSAHFSAASLFNRIPDVIAAPPGIVVVSQMGPMKHTALI